MRGGGFAARAGVPGGRGAGARCGRGGRRRGRRAGGDLARRVKVEVIKTIRPLAVAGFGHRAKTYPRRPMWDTDRVYACIDTRWADGLSRRSACGACSWHRRAGDAGGGHE
jgi:hypothetical protein